MATIRDVARESGVSVATVSYVLNDGPRPVRDETRRQVLAAIERLDYHPNALARGLSSRRTNTLGVLFCRVEPAIVTNEYGTALLQGVLGVASESGFNVTLFTHPWEDAGTSARGYNDGRCDGVIIIAPLLGSDVVKGLSALGLSLVVVSSSMEPGSGIPWVDVDNVAGARLGIRHLISLGHTRIAHLTGEDSQPSVPGRRQGYLQTMHEAGLPVPPGYLAASSYDVRAGYHSTRALLSLPERPSALFAGNDGIALGALEAARDMGVGVPAQFSIVGFDDVRTASLVTPALTTVRQPLVAIGETATRLLVAAVRGHRVPRTDHRTSPELVVRATTAPPCCYRSGAGSPSLSPSGASSAPGKGTQ
jgi:DNA-binding LacI/PurR family transcriptional regulator